MSRERALKNQLWNVSLFPVCNDRAANVDPPEPAPRGGSAVPCPALLSAIEQPSVPTVRAA